MTGGVARLSHGAAEARSKFGVQGRLPNKDFFCLGGSQVQLLR
jgi:hypothetical protein